MSPVRFGATSQGETELAKDGGDRDSYDVSGLRSGHKYLVQLGGFEPPTSRSTVSANSLIFQESVRNAFTKLSNLKVLSR